MWVLAEIMQHCTVTTITQNMQELHAGGLAGEVGWVWGDTGEEIWGRKICERQGIRGCSLVGG